MAVANGSNVGDMDTPNSFIDVEKLIQRLYLPGTPQDISKIQNTLQRLQRSQEGWQFADALLQSLDDKVRFFGALTFTIKINQDWESLNDEDVDSLLDRLLLWLIRLVHAGEGSLVVRKLCSSLIAYFLRPSVSWERPVGHIICCFNVEEVVPRHSLSHHTSIAHLISELSRSHLIALMWFSAGLIEEVGKTNPAGIETHKYHERVSLNLDDTVSLLHHSINVELTGDVKLAEEGVKCLQSWVMYAHRAYIDKAIELEPLRLLTPLALQAFSVEGLLDVAVEFFSDVLTNFPAFFTANDFMSLAKILSSPLAQSYLSTMRAGDFDPEAVVFARMLLAYGDAVVHDLAKNVEDLQSRQILHQLLKLLKCEGYAGVEDEICSQALEFWQTYTEFVTDSLFAAGEQPAPWMEKAREYVIEVIEACWAKIRLPPSDVSSSTWDFEARTSFKAFRADVEDLLQSSYLLLGVDIFNRFANLALGSIRNGAWLHLEATLFCIGALSDSVAEEDSVDTVLSELFASSLFAEMSNQSRIPSKTRRTAVDMITKYSSFFERHSEYLPSVLNFLFESLRAPSMADIAAKAIFTICSSCRKPLIPELGAFLQQYETLLNWEGIEASTKEKVMGAITAIIQALPEEEEKMDPLSALLHSIETDVHRCVHLLSIGKAEEAQPAGLCALRCLVSMGKALQAPDEGIIDLDSEVPQTSVWAVGKGGSMQAKIVQCLETVTSLIQWDSDIMEAGCQVLRTGYKESAPGPFVFPIEVTAKFVTASGLRTAGLDYILGTAGAMLTRHTLGTANDMSDVGLLFLVHLTSLIRSMNGNPTTDPEIASSCIDLAAKMIPRCLDVFLYPQCVDSTPILFVFTIRCLTTTEIMPKRAACQFWASFVQKHDVSETVATMISNTINEYGPKLSQALIHNVGGDAARSELDTIAEPLKKLISAQPKAKMWLSDALFSDTFPSQNVGPADKRIWLQKIINLRGARGTNQAVKEFWMNCRGTKFSYTS